MRRRWRLLASRWALWSIVGSSSCQHWSPAFSFSMRCRVGALLLPILRRLGFRTANEIEEERQALKIARGDYREVASGTNNKLAQLDQILSAIRKC